MTKIPAFDHSLQGHSDQTSWTQTQRAEAVQVTAVNLKDVPENMTPNTHVAVGARTIHDESVASLHEQMTSRSDLFERLKKTAMVWAAVYPSVLVVLSALGDLLQDWPLPLRVLGSTALIVPIVVNITDPAVRAAVAVAERAVLQRRRPDRD